MKCEICKMSEATQSLSQVPNGPTSYMLQYLCEECIKKFSVNISGVKVIKKKKCLQCDINVPDWWPLDTCFKCIIMDEFRYDKKPESLKILLPKKVCHICRICKLNFIGFKSEFDRIGWKEKPDNVFTCDKCLSIRRLKCHICKKQYVYNIKNMGLDFAIKSSGFRKIQEFYYCSSCYSIRNVKRVFNAPGWNKIYLEQVNKKPIKRSRKIINDDNFIENISEGIDEQYSIFYDYRDAKGRLFSTSLRDYIRIEKGIV